jgi:predicted nucleic acid-binding protein
MAFNVFIDVNVLLDFFLERDGFPASNKILNLAKDQELNLFVSPSIIQTSSYFIQKYYGSNTAKNLLLELLKIVQVVESDEEIILQSLNSQIEDIEDAVHYYTAIKHGMVYLVTSDLVFQKVYSKEITLMSPNEFLDLMIE